MSTGPIARTIALHEDYLMRFPKSVDCIVDANLNGLFDRSHKYIGLTEQEIEDMKALMYEMSHYEATILD